MLVVNSVSCGGFEAGQVACRGAVQGGVVPVGVQPAEVDRDGWADVSEVGLAEAAVAGPAASGDGDGLADRGLDTGPALVVVLPVLVLLPGPDSGLQLVDLAGQDGQLPAVLCGFGAELAGRAGPA